MSPLRTVTPGATRTCPHCRATVLESSVKCPQCRKHLRFDPAAAAAAAAGEPAAVPLRVEGTIHAPPDAPWEYSVVVSVRDERGVEIIRQLVHVGAMPAGVSRTFEVRVEAAEPVSGVEALRR